MGIRTTLNLPYEQAVQKTTDALKAEGFGMLAQINFRGYVILAACNPALAHCGQTL